MRCLLDSLPIPAAERLRRDLDLAGTPRRVAEAWLADLLDGYGVDPAAVLRERMPSRGRGLVAVTGIDFHSMCPHHLLPSRGVAHVAYLPDGAVVGFGQIARLVDCFAHRLVLEEDLAESVAAALGDHLKTRGAAVILDAEQSCLSVRGERRRHARAHAQCFTGEMERRPALQARVLALASDWSRSQSRSLRAQAQAGEPAPERAGGLGGPARPADRQAKGRGPPNSKRSRSGSPP